VLKHHYLCWIWGSHSGACKDGDNTVLWNISRHTDYIQHYIPGDSSLQHYLCFRLWSITLWHHVVCYTVTNVLEVRAAFAKVPQLGELMIPLRFTEQEFWGSNSFTCIPELSGLSLCQDTEHPDGGFMVFLSFSCQMPGQSLKLGHNCLFTYSAFTNQPIIRCYTPPGFEPGPPRWEAGD
jgi:hypothetical protein